ncbi:acetoacetate decarboxylase family protein [Sphaerisporangium perillae]|uniref:acetoacetate decarboxylase family protein n=1 Tax=Sphaerisporangium perillae TaxID=2935860 RepID=UPI002010644C|nr:acetoacetate decarboxylase family protein [Sphaerisporangium perillae]
MASHLVQGRPVTLPVEVRDAAVCTAMYLVRADAARAVLAYADLDVTEVLPGKALCILGFVQYADSDLGSYNEFGVGFMVRPPGAARPPARSALSGLKDLHLHGAGAFVHWLPVDQGFTLEAGRALWGFPKELAEVDIRLSSPYKRCILRKDGRLVIDLLIRPGMPVPGTGPVSLDAYTRLDGVTRRIPWTMRPHGIRTRPGGALIRLGNHPIAKELSELGLPKHALFTATVSHLTMSFKDAEPPASAGL